MRRVRVIPALQIDNRKLVKTTRFKSPSYVGDPLNALRIFNEKQVDEIVVIDIGATRYKRGPDLEFIRQLASECFMPMTYGGGISSLAQASEIFKSGVEKVIVGSAFLKSPNIVKSISNIFGSQSVVVSMDVRYDWLSRERVYVKYGTLNTGYSPLVYALEAEQAGAGEILLQSIDREGSQKGYDLSVIEKISKSINIPVVALGGANSISDFLSAIQVGASAVAAGHMFVYKGPLNAVLINYPDQETIVESLYNKL